MVPSVCIGSVRGDSVSMKRTIVALSMAACLAVGLVGCGSNSQATSAADDEPATEISETGPIGGGWEVNAEAGSSVDGDFQSMFEEAMSELDGVDYEPVAVIGKQVVAGMNYAFLCKATPVVADPTTSWSVVVIYKDLSGKASFTTAKDIALDDVQTLKEEMGEAVGAWEGVEDASALQLPAGVDDAFQEALGKLADTELDLLPVALLGSQVVAGSNYQVMCLGRDAGDASGLARPYVALVYRDASGSSEITSLEPLDLVYYVTQ